MVVVIIPDQELKKIEGFKKVVLISQSLSDKYGISDVKRTIEESYDYGGEADIIADVVTNESHYLFAWLREEGILWRKKTRT